MEKRFKEMLVKQDITTLLYKKRGWSVINYSVVCVHRRQLTMIIVITTVGLGM